MAITRNTTGMRLGLVVNNGVTSSGAVKTATLSYGNVSLSATDQGLFDIGTAIGGLSDRAVMSIKLTTTAELEEA